MKAFWVLWMGVSSAQAAETLIFGWDIKCVGRGGLTALAYQSDDDFYLSYQFKNHKPVEGWAGGHDQYTLEARELLFRTRACGVMKDSDVALFVSRDTLAKESTGTGLVYIQGEIHAVNCVVRAGLDEDDYDDVSGKPFPVIREPQK